MKKDSRSGAGVEFGGRIAAAERNACAYGARSTPAQRPWCPVFPVFPVSPVVRFPVFPVVRFPVFPVVRNVALAFSTGATSRATACAIGQQDFEQTPLALAMLNHARSLDRHHVRAV